VILQCFVYVLISSMGYSFSTILVEEIIELPMVSSTAELVSCADVPSVKEDFANSLCLEVYE